MHNKSFHMNTFNPLSANNVMPTSLIAAMPSAMPFAQAKLLKMSPIFFKIGENLLQNRILNFVFRLS